MFASAFVAGLLTIGVSYYFNLKDLRPYLDAQLITANAQAKQAYSSDNLENPRHFHLTTQYPYDHPNFTKELAGVLDATSTVSWSDSYKLKTPFKDLPHIGFRISQTIWAHIEPTPHKMKITPIYTLSHTKNNNSDTF